MSRVYRGLLLFAGSLLIPACGGGGTPRSLPANPPLSLSATAMSTGRIDLAWTDDSNNEFEFRIERSENAGADFVIVGAAPKDSQSFSDLGLLPNRPYVYRVHAWNSGGSSAFAGPATATTDALTWKSSTGGPGVRAEHSAIYDSLGRRMILFGGWDDFFTFYSDVWELDLLPSTAAMTTPPTDHWNPLAPTGAATPNAPTARIGHSAIYDAQNNRMIVFGGQDETPAPGNSYQNDVYILDLNPTIPAWSKPAVSGTPPSPRMGHSASYDAANQRMVVFGGNDVGSEKSDLFFLSLPLTPPFTWSSGPSIPVKRTEHSAVYDGLRQQVVAFGGVDHLLLPDGTELNAQTWTLTLGGASSWTERSFSGTPFFRQGHTAVYDASNQRMILFGGDTVFGPNPIANNELWSLQLDSGTSWTFLGPSSGLPPAARFGHSAIYDAGSKRMVIYGGYDSSLFPTHQDTLLTDF